MGFLNQKEEVLDIKLTPTGERLLMLGALKPAYYAFFDDEVIYDAEYVDISNEAQNDIETRIQDIPRNEVVRAKFSVEEQIAKGSEKSTPEGGFLITEYDIFQDWGIGWSAFGVLDPPQLFANSEAIVASDPMMHINFWGSLDRHDPEAAWAHFNLDNSGLGTPDLSQNFSNKYYFACKPLGTMDYASGDLYPKWNVQFLKAPLRAWRKPTDPYPDDPLGESHELICNINYEFHVKAADLPEAVEADFDQEDPLDSLVLERVGSSLEDMNATPISQDGSYIVVQDDYIFLKIEEENTDFLNDNFDIEIYKVERYKVRDLSLRPEAEIRFLQHQLYFDNQNIQLKDLFYQAEIEGYYNPMMGSEAQPGKALGLPASAINKVNRHAHNFISKYFDVLVDEEIPPEIFCKAVSEDLLEETYVDSTLFDCDDVVTKGRMDPYDIPGGDPNESTEICDDTEGF